MDLGAYMQIEKLEKLAKTNGIEIPRVRGYRLMKEESPITEREIAEAVKDCGIYIVEELCESRPFWNPNPEHHILDERSRYLKNFFIKKDLDGEYVAIKWDRIHGQKRKILKFEIKKQRRKIRQQYHIWNKYAGMDGVLYIHSRMGGSNWEFFDGKVELLNQPWFLDRVDDCFDETYCDFYAKLNVGV